jgi:tetratricopeptide (TPR) repeat protein
MKTSLRALYLLILPACLLLAACQSGIPADGTGTPIALGPTAEAFYQKGDLQAAAKLWEQALADNPEDEQAHYQLALIELIRDPEAAGAHLDEAERLDPTLEPQVSRLKAAIRQANAFENRAYQLTIGGQALASLDEWTLAEIALEMAVNEDPEYAEAWAYLGEARQQNESPGGLEALLTAHALNPDSFSVNLFLSIYYRRNDQAVLAIAPLEHALELDSQNLDLNADLAQTLVDAGRVRQGFEHLRNIAEQSPERSEVWLKLAQLSIDNNLQVLEDGLPAARQAAVLEPENPQAALLLGRGYLLLGESVLAERFLSEAASLDPELPEPHYYLGILYLNADQNQKAEDQLALALSLAQAAGRSAIIKQVETVLGEYFP